MLLSVAVYVWLCRYFYAFLCVHVSLPVRHQTCVFEYARVFVGIRLLLFLSGSERFLSVRRSVSVRPLVLKLEHLLLVSH